MVYRQKRINAFFENLLNVLDSLNSRYGRDHLETQYFLGIRTSDIVQQVSRDEVETEWQLTLDCKKQSRCQLRSTEEDKKDGYGINDGTIAFPVPSVPVGLSLLVGLSGLHSRPVHLNSSRHQTIAGPWHLNVSNSIRKRFHFHIPATPAPVSMQ